MQRPRDVKFFDFVTKLSYEVTMHRAGYQELSTRFRQHRKKI
jgi:hypothetical protein